MPLHTANIRQQFPILSESDLIYLDSAATAQKPECVLNAMDSFYRTSNANVHRGMHVLAEAATVAYEDARKTVASFLGGKPQEIVFTKNCTEAINLVARSWGSTLSKGDTVLLSMAEHHSNIVPWLQLKERIGITVEWFDTEPDTIPESVKLVCMTGLSNVTGEKPDIISVIKKAHGAGAKVLIDAAQLIVHEHIDVKELDCDFLTFSGHKLYGPTGIGALYAKQELLETMPPFLGGGSMIGEVTKEHFTSADIPQKFEAGTPPIAEAVGLKAAVDWVNQCSWADISDHETDLIRYAKEQLQAVEDLTVLGNPTLGCISFVIDGVHPHDLTEILGRKHIALRAGHHCAQPLHEQLGITASTRMSFGLYNTKEDIDACIAAMKEACTTLKH